MFFLWKHPKPDFCCLAAIAFCQTLNKSNLHAKSLTIAEIADNKGNTVFTRPYLGRSQFRPG
jgi:hypothetical protein